MDTGSRQSDACFREFLYFSQLSEGNAYCDTQGAWFDESALNGENEEVVHASGPVAQLGARFHGMEEVIGSIPIRSTIFSLFC